MYKSSFALKEYEPHTGQDLLWAFEAFLFLTIKPSFFSILLLLLFFQFFTCDSKRVFFYSANTFCSGPVFARHLTNRMYRGEYFALQIDSHTRFTSNWDEDIINQWTSIGNEMAVISTYINDITKSIDPISHASLRPQRAMMCKLEYEWKSDPKEHIRFGVQRMLFQFVAFLDRF